MPHKLDIKGIIALLNKQPLVSHVELLSMDEIEKRGFYKLRCQLIPSKFRLDVKFIVTEDELLYAYQLYETEAVARWDNEPHYPRLRNYPDHFHDRQKVMPSELTGNPKADIKVIFAEITKLL